MVVRVISDLVSDLEAGCQSWKKKRGRLELCFLYLQQAIGTQPRLEER